MDSPGRFPRTARLLTKSAYQAVFAHGRKLSDSIFLFIVLARPDGQARLGMAIARRYARTAVERNRVKRLVRETFRQNRPGLPPLDIVVMLRAPTAGIERGVLRNGLRRLWERLGEPEPD